MIDRIADKVSIFLYENSYKNKRITTESLTFGLSVLFNSILIISSVSIMVYLYLLPISVFLSMKAFALLRILTGGYHIKSNDLCVVVSVLMFVMISYITPTLNDNLLTIMSLISLLLVLVFAPSNIPKYAKLFVRFATILKIVAVIILILNLFYFKSYIICTAFFMQSLTLISTKRGFVDE